MSAQPAARVDTQGRVALPAETWRQAGIQPGGLVFVEVTPEGLLLRAQQIDDSEIEIYTDERIQEFLQEDQATPEELARWRATIRR